MIRFILVILTAFLYLILSIPVLLVLLLIRKKKPEVCDKVSRALIRWIFRVILFFAGTKITVEGQENIPKDRAVLYIGNHRSYFDILVTYTTVPGSCGFVAKKELARIGIPAHKIPRVQEELARLTADKILTREELGRLAEEISWLLL